MPLPEYIFCGIDPDLHTTGVAFVEDYNGLEPRLTYAACIKAKGKTEHDAVIAMARALRDHFLEAEHLPPKCNGFAVEAQEMYLSKTKNPRSIMLLANAAGCAIQELVSQYPGVYARFPPPALWKGQVPKHVKQSRAFTKLRIPYEIKGNVTTGSAYCVPDLDHHKYSSVKQGKLNPGDWKHVGDAVGLALWARHEYHHMVQMKTMRKKRA